LAFSDGQGKNQTRFRFERVFLVLNLSSVPGAELAQVFLVLRLSGDPA
jgi:hypothetical protein